MFYDRQEKGDLLIQVTSSAGLTVYKMNIPPRYIWKTVRIEIILGQALSHNHSHCQFESDSDKVYLIQHCIIKSISDLRQVRDFLWVLLFPPSIKLTATI